MSDLNDLDELITHLVRTSRLTPTEAARLVDEVVSFLWETPEQFVRRRHLALQAEGVSNSVIFPRIATEVTQRRVRVPALTERQIRRLIYG